MVYQLKKEHATILERHQCKYINLMNIVTTSCHPITVGMLSE